MDNRREGLLFHTHAVDTLYFVLHFPTHPGISSPTPTGGARKREISPTSRAPLRSTLLFSPEEHPDASMHSEPESE